MNYRLVQRLFLAVLLLAPFRAEAQDAATVYAQASDALAHNDFKTAAPLFYEVEHDYPSAQVAADARVNEGYADLMLGDYPGALAALNQSVAPSVRPDLRARALLFQGMALATQANKASGEDARTPLFSQAVNAFTSLVDLASTSSDPAVRPLLEDALYNRAISRAQTHDYSGAIQDLQTVLQSFRGSLRRPDYLSLLGIVCTTQTQQAIESKRPLAEVQALAAQAVDAFDQVARDPNALVQANDAQLHKAQVLASLGPLEFPDPEGYQKAIDAFSKVQRKVDIEEVQKRRIAVLRAEAAVRQSQNVSLTVATQNGLLLNREENRLRELDQDEDPIVAALIGIAQCYNGLKQFDEARTVLHRLAKAKLTDSEQRQVDIQLIYSYVLGGKTAEADRALTDYVVKHPGDKTAEGLSYQIAATLLQRKDDAGALAQADRSLKDFPQGDNIANVLAIKVAALTDLGKLSDAKAVIDGYLAQHPGSPVAMQMLLSRAEGLSTAGDLPGALEAYGQVKNAATAPENLQAIGWAGYIQTLNAQRQYAQVVTESGGFAAKFPQDKALPGVLVLGAAARDQLNDPGAVAALADLAKRFPNDPAAPYALYSITAYYEKRNDLPKMEQAVADLRTAYPTAYRFLGPATEALAGIYRKNQQFDSAIAAYAPLLDANDPATAAAASNRTGDLQLQAAKAMGHYQSLQTAELKAAAEQRLSSASASFVATLRKFPEQIGAMGRAFSGLESLLQLRRSWGLDRDDTLAADLEQMTAGLSDPALLAHLKLEQASLVFLRKARDAAQLASALTAFRSVLAATPDLVLTPTESARYGELLIAGNDPAAAEPVYEKLLARADPRDYPTLADAYYGLGAAALAEKDYVKATSYLQKLTALPGGAAWYSHINEAKLGLAQCAEAQGQAATAQPLYADLMQSPTASDRVIAQAMLGYGQILEQQGSLVKSANQTNNEFAVHYYEQVDVFYGTSLPDLSAEGLYRAAQAYKQAGDAALGQADLQKIGATYPQTPRAPKAAAGL